VLLVLVSMLEVAANHEWPQDLMSNSSKGSSSSVGTWVLDETPAMNCTTFLQWCSGWH
jgi:hypothetical protein